MARRRTEPQTRPAADLRSIARSQRVVVSCLFAQVAVWGAFVFLGRGFRPFEGGHVPVLVSLVIGVIGAVHVGRIGAKVSGLVVGVFFGLLAAIPYLGVVLLLTGNSQARATLKANGVRVGWFGANRTDLAGLVDDPDLEGGPRDDRRSVYDVNEAEGW